MAVGDLVTIPYRYEYRNFAFGSGTSYITEKVTGLLAMPPIRDTDIEKAFDHGSWPGRLLTVKRTVAFDLKVVGTAGVDIEDKLKLARSTFRIPRRRYSRVLEPFVFWRPGTNSPKKVLYVRCTKRDFTSDYETARGLASGSVELVAPDPVILSLVPKQQNANMAPATQNANLVLNNVGDFADGYEPLIVLTGPLDNPRIQNTDDDNRTIRIDISLAAVDSLRINVKTKKIEVQRGVAGAWVDAYVNRRNDNQWWSVLPGDNDIVFTRAVANSGAQCTITITWQDAWE